MCGISGAVLASIGLAVRVGDVTHKEEGCKVKISWKENIVHRKLINRMDFRVVDHKTYSQLRGGSADCGMCDVGQTI
jgi:hypothetical protein